MAKGDISFVKCMNSVGTPAGIYDDAGKRTGTQDGVYSHSQTVNGVTFRWKCGALKLKGVVKLVEDEYNNNVFYRMEGMVDDVADMNKINDLSSAIEAINAGGGIAF